MTYTLYDLDILARTLIGEAEHETLKGQQAVVAVIYNRAKLAREYMKRTGKKSHVLYGNGTLASAAKANEYETYKQFSCWNKDTLKRNKIDTLAYNDPRLLKARAVVKDTLDKKLDPTIVATHYFGDYIDPPSWADESRFTIQIGKHRFYDLAGEFEKGKLLKLLSTLSKLLKRI